MAEVSNIGNGAVPNRVLAWTLALFFGVGGPLAMLWQRAEQEAAHAREVLALRDRVHEAVQGELRAKVSGQDEVLQREMRLLVDTLNRKIDHVEEVARVEREWIKDRVRYVIEELFRVRDGVFVKAETSK